MPNHHPGHNGPPQIENLQLKKLIELAESQVLLLEAIHYHQHLDSIVQHQILRTLRVIAFEVNPVPRLTEVKIAFVKGPPMSTPVIGPIVLAPGETAQAVLLGFDQSGAPFTGTMPPSTFVSDDPDSAVVTFDPTTGQTVAVAAGVANITGSADTTDASGNPVTLSDTESVTVTENPPPPQQLTTVKVGWLTDVPQATPLAAPRRRK